jgi:hypothetical protein
MNWSDIEFIVYWVNQETQETIIMRSVGAEQEIGLNTYMGHKFRLKEQPSITTGLCQNEEQCLNLEFKVEPNRDDSEEFIVTIKPNHELIVGEISELSVERSSSKRPAVPPLSQIIQKCRALVERWLSQYPNKENQVFQSLSECIETGIIDPLIAINDEIEFHSIIREEISEMLENVTCIDPNLGTSPDIDQRTWTSEKDGISRNIHVKLDKSASRIHVIENFASVEECQAIAEEAGPKLKKASVADGKGGIQFSENRKAWQAAIHPKYEMADEGDLVAQLGNRVYEYTNHVLNMNISYEGQEPLMSIQYFGRGYNDTAPDRYTPHCDGKCTGEPHRSGSRVATAVIYW